MKKTGIKALLLGLVLGLLLPMTITANARSIRVLSLDNISYIDSDGVEHFCNDYTILTSSMTSLAAGWYVVNDDLEFSSKITLTGNVNLILCNGKTMTISGYSGVNDNGIDGGSSYELNVYGQTLDDKTAGCLKVEVRNSSHYGINVKKYTQHSGTVFLKSNSSIGLYASNSITLRGGTLDVTASTTAIYAKSASFSFYGGKVIAKGSAGIYGSSITLDWKNNTDMIRASSYSAYGSIKITSGTTFFDGTTSYSGTLYSSQISAIAGKTLAPAWLGSGTEDDPWQILGRGHLDILASSVNSGNKHIGDYFKVMNDIFYPYSSFSNEENYVGIGEAWSSNSNSFRGHFDGDNHTISGIRIYQPWVNKPCQGLFRSIDEGAEVKNTILEDTRITSHKYVGGIVGYSRNGTVTNCQVKPTVTIYALYEGPEYHGGVVGINMYGTINNCVSSARLSKKYSNDESSLYGGIAGYSEGTLTNCLVLGATIPAVSNSAQGALYGAITCINTNASSNVLANNFYAACRVAGVADAKNVGCGQYNSASYSSTISDITTNHSAEHAIGRTVEGYDNSEDSDHWVLISSPLAANVAPTAVFGLTANPAEDYDLFKLVNTTWANYKEHEGNIGPNFNMVNGQGYLYASKSTTTLAFIGAYNTGSTMSVNLDEGWNLVGNPFPTNATVSGKSYYVMNDEGTALDPTVVASGGTIAPCTGVIVQASSGESVTFSSIPSDASAPHQGSLQIVLSQAGTRSNAVVDKAVVSFDEGSQLEKFYFGEQNANIYFPQGDAEFAIAYSDKTGEVPVNFKARKDGEYTLNVSSPLSSQFSTLTLIDNMTGTDVDLLASPSYTFNARTTDYASRFRLVFSTYENDNEDFAFFSNGEIIINGTGSLQVIDILGRVILNKELSTPSSHLSVLNYTPGVYVLRLIGEKVKIQKIVVK